VEVHKTGFPSSRLVHKSLSALISPYRSAQMAGAVITFPRLGPSISLIPGWYSQHSVCTCEGNGSIRSSSTFLAGGHKRIAPKAFLHVPPSLAKYSEFPVWWFYILVFFSIDFAFERMNKDRLNDFHRSRASCWAVFGRWPANQNHCPLGIPMLNQVLSRILMKKTNRSSWWREQDECPLLTSVTSSRRPEILSIQREF
jgi:hypothetical protein